MSIRNRSSILYSLGLVLLAGSLLACSLSAQAPTLQPTQTPFIITSTSLPVTNTPAATATPGATLTSTRTSGGVGCTGASASWVSYIVQAGDTLGTLAQRTGATVSQLAAANCMTNPNLLAAGQVIRLPRQPISLTVTPLPVIRWGGTPPNMLCIVVPAVANAPIYSDAGLISFRAFLGDWAPWVENLPWGGSTVGAFRIQLPDGTTAYMPAASVQLRGNCGIVPPTVPPTWTNTPTAIPFPDATSTPIGT